MRVVGICGTPGTGKKTLAPLVADLLGLPAVGLNSLIPRGEEEVDPAALRRALLALPPRRAVVYGHLLPHVVQRREASFVAVLRCEPSVLRSRLAARGYPSWKVVENVEAELIGVVIEECVKRFGVVREYDATEAPPSEIAGAVARDAKASHGTLRGSGRRAGRPRIDWTLDYDSSTKLRSLLEGGGGPPGST